MDKKYLTALCMTLLLGLLVGCIPLASDTVHIYGYVEDKYDNKIEGIKVTCEGATEVTGNNGYFDFYMHNVQGPDSVDLFFEGPELDFQPFIREVLINPGQKIQVDHITMTRKKALVKGRVIVNYQNSAGLATLDGTHVTPATPDGPAYPEGEVIVKFKDGLQLLAADQVTTQMDLHILAQHPSRPYTTFKTRGNMEETIAQLEARPDVEFAEPNYYVYPSSYSSPDPERSLDQRWNMEAINAVDAWEIAKDSSDIYVAVLDTGIKAGIIPENNILWELGKDFVDNDDDPSVSTNSHGTQVADIIYQTTGGLVSIIPIRILKSTNNDSAYGTVWELLQGLEYALNNADIINLSLSIKATTSEVASINDLLWSFHSQGKMKLIIGAAGNDSTYSPTYPASSNYVLSVGAVGPTLQPASYTNRGVDLYAPGGDYNLYPIGVGNTIRTAGQWVEGTSIASAHVAGVAAMVMAENPSMSLYELRDRLEDRSLNWSYTDGAGLVDAIGAIKDLNPQRPLVFFGDVENKQESSYTYIKDGVNYFEIAAVEPGYRQICVWVDKNGNNVIDYWEPFSQQTLSINKGDILDDIELYLEVY